MPIMGESGLGDPINAIKFYSVNISWVGKLFCPITLVKYEFKCSEISLELYLNSINSGYLGPL